MTATAEDFWINGAGAHGLSWDDRDVELQGRGRTSVREVHGPSPDAPTLILLHGLAATGRLNWFTSLSTLAQRYRLIVVDHRGHGRGIRTHRFRLADCADDAIAIADVLGVESAIAVGYSMGGPIAKLCWNRHPDRVRGLVLCATANHFMRPEASGAAAAVFPGIVVTARLAPKFFLNRIVEGMTLGINDEERRRRAIEEMSSTDAATVMQAARATIRFSSRDWASNIDVPTAVVITTKDMLVSPKRQYRLAESIPNAKIFRVPGDHLACVRSAGRFVPTLLKACDYVDAAAGEREEAADSTSGSGCGRSRAHS